MDPELAHLARQQCDPEKTMLAARKKWYQKDKTANVSLSDEVAAILQEPMDGLRWEYFVSDLRASREVCLLATAQCGEIFRRDWFPEAMRSDPEICLAVARQDGRILSADELPALMAADPSVVTAAVSAKVGSSWREGPRTLYAFEFAPIELRTQRSVCLAAVRRHGSILGKCSFPAELRADREVVLTAIRAPANPGDRSPLEFAVDALKEDPEVLVTAFSRRGIVGLTDGMSATDVMLAACAQHAGVFRYASRSWRKSQDFVATVIMQVSSPYDVLRFASRELREDPALLALAASR